MVNRRKPVSLTHVIGFGSHRDVAVDLFKDVVGLLKEIQLTGFLISGTLLGKIRHNDLIPWDDDMDLMVQENLFDKLPEIREKYPHLHFICADHMTYVKVSYKDRGYQIPPPANLKHDFCEDKVVANRWPFIDLFVYSETDESINFYHRVWDKTKFFPLTTTEFIGTEVSMPVDPDYFLRYNYGSRYMTEFIHDGFYHKFEKRIGTSRSMK